MGAARAIVAPPCGGGQCAGGAPPWVTGNGQQPPGGAIVVAMYRDNSLIPSEAVRLCALGTLAERAHSYAELAAAVRHFTSRIVGPSLDLLSPSLELLRVEGLIEADAPEGDEAPIRLTAAGRA